MDDDRVGPQRAELRNSLKIGPDQPDVGQPPVLAQKEPCYWNDKRYSDGGTVCEGHQRFKCWNGSWVDVGDC